MLSLIFNLYASTRNAINAFICLQDNHVGQFFVPQVVQEDDLWAEENLVGPQEILS